MEAEIGVSYSHKPENVRMACGPQELGGQLWHRLPPPPESTERTSSAHTWISDFWSAELCSSESCSGMSNSLRPHVGEYISVKTPHRRYFDTAARGK